MNKWIYSLILIVGLIVGLVGGFALSNLFVVKPLSASYGKQIDRKDELIATLAKIPNNLIENTLTVKKVKRGSSVYYVPTSDLKAVEIKMDSLISWQAFPEDTVKMPRQSLWDKIADWFNFKKEEK